MSEAPWLVVVDHQRVFADPTSDWGSPMFADTVPVVADLAREHRDRVITTRWVPAPDADRVGSWVDYFQAWPFADKPAGDPMFDLVPSAVELGGRVLTRPTFGKWSRDLEAITGPGPSITLVGVSTDCCVISTALAAADGGAKVRVIAAGCAGSSPEAHEQALAVMRLYAPQIEVV
ncbi:cysteine hydrolase family protein [Pseudactinotalea sp.]|uniref:cysteine hydrolase family protein n=1 Tax=Pseudactinotalea sp. TaxID=1926260 RepID=UPI003B3BC480